MKMINKKLVPISFLTLLTIAVVMLLWLTFRPATSALTYQTTIAAKGNLLVSVTASGSVISAGSINAVTKASGVVGQVFVARGDSVQIGQKLADVTLDGTSRQSRDTLYSKYRLKKDTLASSLLGQAAANSSYAAELANYQALQSQTPAATPGSLLTGQAAVDGARKSQLDAVNAVRQAKIDVSIAWTAYQESTGEILSPGDGIVNNLTIVPGAQVDGSSTPFAVASIQSAHQSYANLTISEIDMQHVALGQPVLLSVPALPSQKLDGKIVAIDSNGIVKSGVIHYTVTVSVDNAPIQLLANMSVDAKVVITQKDNVIIVPSSAVKSAAGSSVVALLVNGKPSTVTVNTGLVNDTQTEITSGVSIGDKVITATLNSQSKPSGSSSSSIFNGLTSPSSAGLGAPGTNQNN